MKNGLIEKDGELIYYKEDRPYHAGVIKIDSDIYYIGRGGKAVKGVHVVHGAMTNEIIKRGTYTFGDDYKLVEGSYIAPERRKSSGKKKSKSKGKKRKLSKRERIVSLCAALTIITILIVAAVITDIVEKPNPEETTVVVNTTPNGIVLPTFDEEVLLCSKEAKALYEGKITVEEAEVSGDPYRPFVFRYDLCGASGILKLSEHSDLSEAKEYILASNKASLTIDNLKTGTQYYYEVSVGEDVYPGSFKTAESTRFISLPGVFNTRDIGGYTNLDGKKIKQGLIIRGTEIDGLMDTRYFLDDAGVAYALDEFGFVYDFDLRERGVFSGEYISRFGLTVKHKFYVAPMYGAIFNSASKETIKSIFSDLAKPENYPMYMHCTYGSDRTGTIVFLLQGILNMSEEDMLREYHMTGFSMSGYETADYIETVVAGLQNYPGDTIGEKIESYLKDTIGVTEEEIEAIRDIMLED